MHTYRASQDLSVLADHLEVPGLGFLPVNAFVVHAAQPVVVDTGLGLPDRDFIAALAEVIDPADVAWIWLTHPDHDHTGGLFTLLEAARTPGGQHVRRRRDHVRRAPAAAQPAYPQDIHRGADGTWRVRPGPEPLSCCGRCARPDRPTAHRQPRIGHHDHD